MDPPVLSNDVVFCHVQSEYHVMSCRVISQLSPLKPVSYLNEWGNDTDNMPYNTALHSRVNSSPVATCPWGPGGAIYCTSIFSKYEKNIFYLKHFCTGFGLE